MAENNKSKDRSLFLYMGLIFLVAVLLIVLSYLGQKNLEKKQNEISEAVTQETAGITERAAALSEENKNLIEENNSLKAKLDLNDKLLAANGYVVLGAKDKALEILEEIDYDSLTYDQQIIYNDIKNSN